MEDRKTFTDEECLIKVLDGSGSIELVDYMGGDLGTVNAARVSFGKRKEKFVARDKKLVKYLADNKHFSPFRHTMLKFHVKAPEYVARQAMRHLVGVETTSNSAHKDTAINEISGRYVVLEPEFFTPAKFRKQSSDNKQASTQEEVDCPIEAHRVYDDALEYVYEAYEKLLAMGVCKEQARGLIPVCFMTEWYWTMSLQAVENFITLRDDDHAQWEIREYAIAMKKLAERVAPESLNAMFNDNT